MGLEVTLSQDLHLTNFCTMSENSVLVESCLFVNIDNLLATEETPSKPTALPFLSKNLFKILSWESKIVVEPE